MTTIWVTDEVLYADMPTIRQYEAITVRKSGATVRQRGAQVIIRPALGRKVWTDKEEALQHVRDRAEFNAARLRHRLETLEARLQSDDFPVEVVPAVSQWRDISL